MSTGKVTAITAAHPGAYRWLLEAGMSLLEQQSDVRWIVAADDLDTAGVERALKGASPELIRRTELIATGRPKCGAAVARTAALLQAETPYITVLDCDDMWLPGGIDTLVKACEEHDVRWAVGGTDHLTESIRGPWMEMGEWGDYTTTPGEFLDLIDKPLPFHPCSMVAHTDAVLQVGGWPAFPVAEDSGLSFALLATMPGRLVAEQVFLYRRWSRQTTIQVPQKLIMAWHEAAVRRARYLMDSEYSVVSPIEPIRATA